MPTIDMDLAEFEKMLGVEFHGDMEKLDDLLALVKSEVKLYNQKENIASIELKDTNRPDLWSVEGLARTLRSYLNLQRGMRQYSVEESIIDVHVDSRLKSIRPFIGCAIIKNVNLSDAIIRGLMHMQDKLDKTYGRNRQKTSIGLYNIDMLDLPLSYTVADPDDCSFIPLGFSEELTLKEILERHPKGLEYGHIVKNHKHFPILLDAKKKVLSFPPVINSNDVGRITAETRNLLIEVTGTQHQTVLNTLVLVASALIERGGKVYSAKVYYADDKTPIITPNFSNKQMVLNIEYANKILGLNLTSSQMADLLITAGFGIEGITQTEVEVTVPCYRIDVMHPIDLVEDVAVAFGYNNIEPLWRDLPTTGAARPQQRLVDIARDLMVGSGYQEVLTYTLTNPENLFAKMNCEPADIVEISNPKVVTMTCIRNKLLPGLIEFLSVNQSVTFPQRIFELGKVTLLDDSQETKTRDEEWLAAVSSHAEAGFSEIKSCIDAFFTNLGITWKIEAANHPSFIEGRTGAIIVSGLKVGLLGEISPQVLESWKLENPTVAFEMNIEQVLKIKQALIGGK
jgi:phenylalanyl-tRNA synthetase beta chain